MRPTLLALCTALIASPAARAQAIDDWREDLRVLATELPARHKNAFARITRAQWDSAVQRLDARLPQLKRHEAIVEFMRLVALVGDGHTSLVPDEHFAFHRFPVQLFDFEDGLYVMSADSAHADIVGAKVNQIGPSSGEAAVRMAGRLVSHESPNWVRAQAPSLLSIPEVVAALGLGRDTLTADFVVEQNGRQRTVTLTGTRALSGNGHGGAAMPVDMRRATRGDDPLWLRKQDVPFWFSLELTADRVLYIRYRAVAFIHNGELNEQFFRRAFSAGDSAKVERVVLDMRDNGGGNNFLNRNVVREILQRPRLDQPDRLFVLIDRGVFSAAQNLVNELDFYTNATFVGEPTGNAPNQYGDARPLELPRSKLVVRVSSLYWQSHAAADDRNWFAPDIYAELSSGDYRTKRDPVLEAALRRASEPTLEQRILRTRRDGAPPDTAAVRRLIDGYRNNPENRYRNFEADINAAGYHLLRSGETDAAIAAFRVNTDLYPLSGNTFDSLGEALEKAGKKEEAITAYRRAVTLDPRLFSSRDALQRLGASP